MKISERFGLLSGVVLASTGLISAAVVPIASAGQNSQTTQTITFWDPDIASWQPLYKQLVSSFEKLHPNITVNLVNIPQSGFTQKLNTAFAAGQGPDVFAWLYSRDMYLKGFIQPLDSYIKRDHWNMNQYFQPITNLRTKGLDGHYYALPRDVSIDTVFYNKNLFLTYHIPFPKAGWTWADFERDAKQLTHPAAKVYGTDMTNSDWWLAGYPWVWDFGGDMISQDGWNVQGLFNSSAVAKVTAFAQKMQKDGSVVPSSLAQTFGSGDYADLLSGRVGMVQGSLWGVEALLQQNKIQWGDVQLPTPPGVKKPYAWMDSVLWYMNAHSQHKDASWELMKYLSSPAAGDIVAKSMTWGPPTIKTWIDTGLYKDPHFKAMFAERHMPSEIADYLRNANFWSVPEPIIGNAYQQIVAPLAGKPYAPIASTLAAAAEKAQKALDQNKSQQG